MNVMPVSLPINAGINEESWMKKINDEIEDLSEDSIESRLSWYAPEDNQFVKIDRKQEDENVIKYQKTHDMTIFEKLYQDRIPSLQIWARRYHWLTDSKENMFGELRFYFMKAVNKYQKNRGSFNTCLYTFLLNCVRNLKTGKKAKKRKPEGADPNSTTNFILSLNYPYGNSKDGDGRSLMDIISDKIEDKKRVTDQICLEETMDILSSDNRIIRKFMMGLSDGHTLGNMIKSFKIKQGNIKISKNCYSRLVGKKKNKKIVANLIRGKKDISDDFSVVDYAVTPNTLVYTIEMKKTKESDLILRTVRKLRRNREHIMERINR